MTKHSHLGSKDYSRNLHLEDVHLREDWRIIREITKLEMKCSNKAHS